MDLLIGTFTFILGVCIGSFLNVLALRYVHEESIKGRSHCAHCGKILRWWELIPIFSFLFLAGKCQRCRKPISWRYPLVEIITGLLFFAAFNPLPTTIPAVLTSLLLASILSTLVVLFLIDLAIFILPDQYVLLLTGLVLAFLVVNPHQFSFMNTISGAVIGSGFLVVLWLVTGRKGIGLGDVKLLIPLGLLLGVPGVLVLLWASFSVGGIVGLYLLARGKAHLKTPLPFGPFLTGVAMLLLLFPHLVDTFFTTIWPLG